MATEKVIVPGGVDEYIANYPSDVQVKLKEIRGAIEAVSEGAIQTVSYFSIPGYSYPGFDYNGMFAWFSFKKPYIRLHVRPPVLENHKEELKNFIKTNAILSFPMDEKLPLQLIKKLVKSSIQIMKET
jgi:uncharacterized protein YdhG (YjbR/CyaY superfamily)